MKILVTGASGFIGRHVVKALISRGHQVTAVDIDETKARQMPWFEQCRFVTCDVYKSIPNIREIFGEAEAVIHLVWPGLPNYKSLFHYEINLPADYKFLKSLVTNGYSQILVAGTCFEYGMKNGCLSEEMVTNPNNSYALAKDTLRKFLEMLSRVHPFQLQWARLFYLYGEGQNPNSILAQLQQAINRGDEVFNMSGGEQLRDYLPVEKAAEYIVRVVENREFSGIVNICSGHPISVRNLVENYLVSQGKTMRLNLGYYPYPDYEPMAFWGDTKLLNKVIGES